MSFSDFLWRTRTSGVEAPPVYRGERVSSTHSRCRSNYRKHRREFFNTNLCIDQDRTFSTGFSFGGMMSYTVGYQFDVFRAIAPCSGDLQVIPHDESNTDPLPVMAFHGDNDDFVTTARGRAARDKYLMRNHCGTQTQPAD
jgi:dienelactone hydrolase